MPSVRSREIARSQRSCVQHCEDALKALNLGYGLLGVHFVSISAMSVAVVKLSALHVRRVRTFFLPMTHKSVLHEPIHRFAVSPEDSKLTP
jgi:hypothetical protein